MPIFCGIDVSKYQGVIDWGCVKEDGVDFAMIRLGYVGKYGAKIVDTHYDYNLRMTKEKGIARGVYLYSYAATVEEASREADFVIEKCSGESIEYPIAYDWEEYGKNKLDWRQQAFIIDAFCSKVEAAGYYVVLYMPAYDLSRLNKLYPSIIGKYDKWVAHVEAMIPAYTGKYGIWQYSWRGRVNGVSGNVDLDYAYKDYESIMRKNRLNGMEEKPNGPRTIEIS